MIYEKLSLKNALLSKYWNLWSKLCITILPPIVKNSRKQTNLKFGNIVLIKNENTPRMCWPLGVVSEVYFGFGRLVRNVRLKTANGYATRSVQRLYDLEIYSDQYDYASVSTPKESIQPSNSDESVIIKARSGRTGKPVSKY